MTEHTPTPWTIDPMPYASWIGAIGNNPSDPQLWSVATPYPKGDKRADAKLIVKAVNSHDALVKMLEWLDRRGGLGIDVHERIRGLLASVGAPGK